MNESSTKRVDEQWTDRNLKIDKHAKTQNSTFQNDYRFVAAHSILSLQWISKFLFKPKINDDDDDATLPKHVLFGVSFLGWTVPSCAVNKNWKESFTVRSMLRAEKISHHVEWKTVWLTTRFDVINFCLFPYMSLSNSHSFSFSKQNVRQWRIVSMFRCETINLCEIVKYSSIHSGT